MSTPRNYAFYLELGIRSMQGGERLYYKRDGGRWGSKAKARRLEGGGGGGGEEEDVVVKLNVLQIYALTVTVRPGKDVRYMWLDGQKLELKTSQRVYPDDDAIKYTSQWTTTTYEVTKQGERKKLPIEVEFTTGEYLKSEVHVKFYPANDRVHSRVGRMFGTLSLLCHAPENTFVNVLKKQLL
ncbi:uncharacterized protein LOC143281567 [Babylonia areolata]|uniref:uncharacterized protein LOC143281567 n=1 Tax=Babylonia areolata TaxID=304850 RepID=UPI003FD0F241